jgi:hypothetical protein
MSTATAREMELASENNNLKVSRIFTTLQGNKFRTVVSGLTTLLVNETDPNYTIIVTGIQVAEMPGLSDIVDGITGAIKGLLALITCKPQVKTVVETHKDGTVTTTTTMNCAQLNFVTRNRRSGMSLFWTSPRVDSATVWLNTSFLLSSSREAKNKGQPRRSAYASDFGGGNASVASGVALQRVRRLGVSFVPHEGQTTQSGRYADSESFASSREIGGCIDPGRSPDISVSQPASQPSNCAGPSKT